jgi:hypothetical protein
VRHVRRVAVLVLLAVTACSKGENRAADSTPGTPAAQNAQALVAQQRAPIPGELTKPIADYTGDELVTLVNSLQFGGGNERGRRCDGAAVCTGPNAQTTRVRVEGVVGADSVLLLNGSRFGVIVARGRNLGANRESMYGMLPGNRYTYLLIALPGQGNTARWQIEQVDVNGNNRSHSPLSTGTLQACGHQWYRGARSDFRTCADPVLRPASTMLLQGGEPPWWYPCSEGCCIATSIALQG